MSENTERMLQDMVRAAWLLQSDQPPKRMGVIEIAYLHGLSRGMEESADLFRLITDYAGKYACGVSFNGSDGRGMPPQDKPGAAWPGKDWYIEELTAQKLLGTRLYPTRPGLHTRDEADAFIELSEECGWKSASIFSVGYHSVRSMSCMIAAMETAGYFMRLHFIVPPTTNAWHPIKGSQGVADTITFEEIEKKEISNVLKYWERGGADPPNSWRAGYTVPPKYLFHYLQYRDEIVATQKFPLFPLE